MKSTHLRLAVAAALAIGSAAPLPIEKEVFEQSYKPNALPTDYFPKINREFTRSGKNRWKGSRKSGGKR